MSLIIRDLDGRTKKAIKLFWKTRRKKEGGKKDIGQRGNVTGGKHLDGFTALIGKLVVENGLPDSSIKVGGALPTLPGFFRPTKKWDLLIIYEGTLLAAIEIKSHCGPSFGNNLNNRCEEALGNAVDLLTAYRDGAFGKKEPKPFLGFIMLVEDCDDSNKTVKISSPYFRVLPEFEGTSYVQRYELMCDKLMKEGLYTAAALILTKKRLGKNATYSDSAGSISLKSFTAQLAGHIAAATARQRK